MWQKCPICNGSGLEPSFQVPHGCGVCKGERILSELTGLPPKRPKEINIGDLNINDFNQLDPKNRFDDSGKCKFCGDRLCSCSIFRIKPSCEIPSIIIYNPTQPCVCDEPIVTITENNHRVCTKCLKFLK